MAAVAVPVAGSVARVASKPRTKSKPRLAAPLPPEIHSVQEIDNSRLRRIADPREFRTMMFCLAVGAFVFVAFLGFCWQQFAIVKDGYDIADLKAKRDALVEENKILASQAATLRNPERVSNYAYASLGLTQPKQGQILRMEPVLPGSEAEPVLARLRIDSYGASRP